jgi:hypothetical protein
MSPGSAPLDDDELLDELLPPDEPGLLDDELLDEALLEEEPLDDETPDAL